MIFVGGGLLGLLLFRWWMMALTSLSGTLIAVYCGLSLMHRLGKIDALAWSERCRHLYSDFGLDYASYAMGRLEDRCCNIPLR